MYVLKNLNSCMLTSYWRSVFRRTSYT